MFAQRAKQQLVIDVVEEPFDVELNDPVVPPAALSHDTHGIQGGSPWTIAIRIGMKQRVQPRFQQQLRCCLGHPVGHRRHAQHSHAP